MASSRRVSLSELRATEQNCQLCALLLRAAKRYCNAGDERNVEILRKSSALQIGRAGRAGPHILRLWPDPG